MSLLISKFMLTSMAFAEEGHGHSHGPGGETEHLFPVMAVFALLVVGGVIFHFVSKKKK